MRSSPISSIVSFVDCGKVLWKILLICGISACHTHLPIQSFQVQGTYRDYQQALDTWTRHQEVFEYFEGKLFVHATCLAPSFIIEQSKHQQKRLLLSKKEFQQLKQQQLHQSKDTLRFLMSIHTPDDFMNDLRRFNPTLKVNLLYDGHILEPTRIQSISFEDKLDLTESFPYLNPMSQAYWVSFNYPDHWNQTNSLSFTLRVASMSASTQLTWQSTQM